MFILLKQLENDVAIIYSKIYLIYGLYTYVI